MTNLFKSVRRQNDSITAGLEEMKSNFRDFLSKTDNKQEKLDHFIESFNKFTEKFPELRPDEQTKEELNNRCDLLNEDFWDIIKENKEVAIEERARIIGSGWIEHELQQLTIKAQQFIGSEIKRCISCLNFIHKYFMSKKNVKFLDEYENMFSQKYSLSLFDESSDQGGQIDLPKVEDADDPNNFPLLNTIFRKGLGIVHLIDTGIAVYDQSDFEVREAANIERSLLIFRTRAVCSWVVRELKDIRLKFNEVYSKLDDWIVVYTKNENENVNEVISSIRQTIESNKPLDIDMRISTSDIQADEDGVKFIEAVLDKSFIQTGGQTKFSLDQAQEYTSIFKKFARNEFIRSSKAVDILVTNLKLRPEMIPMKWKEYPLSHIHKMVTRLEDEDNGLISWRVFITLSVLSEAFSAVIDRKSVVRPYRQSLKKAAAEFAECITLEAFLKVKAWFDEHLSMRKKHEVVYEEDKQEIVSVKALLYKLNVGSNGLLNIDKFADVLETV